MDSYFPKSDERSENLERQSNKKYEEEIKINILIDKDGELDIKGEFDLENEEDKFPSKKFIEINIEKEEEEIDENKIEKYFRIHIDNLNEKNYIYNVYSLSNERFAVLDKDGTFEKIYDLNTGKYITKITNAKIKNITELKNKDLVLNSSYEIYLYKLLPNKNL